MNGSLSKDKPQGVEVNTAGYDGNRGHYARWDAASATCFVRVAAYNKDTPITNQWLFGAAGDDQSAEVWMSAGDTFTCNKDLFGFSLMNKTKTAAVVGIGGGTLLGAGIGAVAGHSSSNFDCDNKAHREELTKQLRNTQSISITNEYLDKDINLDGDKMSEKSCREIIRLYDVVNQYQSYVNECDNKTIATNQIDINCKLSATGIPLTETKDCYEAFKSKNDDASKEIAEIIKKYCYDGNNPSIEKLENCKTTINQKINNMTCLVKNLNKERISDTSNIYCGATDNSCISTNDVKPELERLNKYLFTSSVRETITDTQRGNRAKTTAAGAAIGAGVGGIATAITAFVEKGNINCRVGDGMSQVSLGKSHSIDTLKDVYVKWNLNLPDVITPTATVSDCDSWKRICATTTNLEDCANAEFNWIPNAGSIPKNIKSPCVVSGSTCIPNETVIQANNVCPSTGTGTEPQPPVR